MLYVNIFLLFSEFDMSNPHLGFEKPVPEKPCVGTQVLPLAPPLPTLQQVL